MELTVVGTAMRGFSGPGGGKPLPDLKLVTVRVKFIQM